MAAKGGKEKNPRGSPAQEQSLKLLGQETFKDWQQNIQNMLSTGLQQIRGGMAHLSEQIKDLGSQMTDIKHKLQKIKRNSQNTRNLKKNREKWRL